MSHLSCEFVLTFMQLQTPRRYHPRTCSPTLHTIGLVLLLNLAKPSCFLLDPPGPLSSEHWVREAEVPEGCGVGFGVEAVQLGVLRKQDLHLHARIVSVRQVSELNR